VDEGKGKGGLNNNRRDGSLRRGLRGRRKKGEKEEKEGKELWIAFRKRITTGAGEGGGFLLHTRASSKGKGGGGWGGRSDHSRRMERKKLRYFNQLWDCEEKKGGEKGGDVVWKDFTF